MVGCTPLIDLCVFVYVNIKLTTMMISHFLFTYPLYLPFVLCRQPHGPVAHVWVLSFNGSASRILRPVRRLRGYFSLFATAWLLASRANCVVFAIAQEFGLLELTSMLVFRPIYNYYFTFIFYSSSSSSSSLLTAVQLQARARP